MNSLTLKQAPGAWYERLKIIILKNGYAKGSVDNTLFVKKEKDQLIVAQIYVDDIVFGRVSNQLVKQFVQQMEAKFEMSMVGELKYFLEFQINQMEDSIFISQAKCVKNIVKKFGLKTAKSKRTPIAKHVKMTKDEDGKSVDISVYRCMIGSLLYLIASRPDISHSVGVCARYQVDPKKAPLLDIVMLTGHEILRTGRVPLEVASFRGIILFHGLASSRIQYLFLQPKLNILLLEVDVLNYFDNIFEKYGVKQGVMTLYYDNICAISIAKNPVQHSRTKHIDIRHHFIRELIEDKVINLEHINSDKQATDIFTKGLDVNQFEYLRTALGLCVIEK
ncbi:hypothetical protein LIER_05236 [Lithospermum erythrorhizon]|uniref:Reverse transcriptase Ty1/copia-type domain-containing protein n=1 Tax=Lithospermum erythrorhizon TaxID=34254 RepID=A0AAV3P0Q2_LITER